MDPLYDALIADLSLRDSLILRFKLDNHIYGPETLSAGHHQSVG